jgi:two-component system sensor histidine kinase KdpD
MSGALVGDGAPYTPATETSGGPRSSRGLPILGQYAVSALLVGAATVLAFVVDQLIAAPNLTLIFVLPVMIAATAFGWGPALAAVILGVLAFDFFFAPPLFTLRIDRPSDIWAAVLLLAVAAIATTVATQSRRRALEAAQAADRAEALQALAQVVIAERPRSEVLQAAAEALSRIFRAPAVIFLQDGGALRRAATAGRPQITAADDAAAAGAFANQLHTRAQTYPYDQSQFEFWPVTTPAHGGCVIGVDFTHARSERPEKPERFVDVVAAYLAAPFGSGGARRG